MIDETIKIPEPIIDPATSMVEVKKLIDPAMLVEIEAEAFIGAGQARAPSPAKRA